MKLELAEGGLSRGGYRGYKARYHVHGYDRSANVVPSYTRRYPRMNDSSLMTFKLADGSALLYICVPDPQDQQAPRLVREDYFDNLSDNEFNKLLAYVSSCNSPQVLQQVATRRMNQGLGDGEISPGGGAGNIVEAAHQVVPDGIVVKSTSFFDQNILGIPVKWLAIGAGAWFLLK